MGDDTAEQRCGISIGDATVTADKRDIVLTGALEQARGVIGRYPGPDEQFIFEFDSVERRRFHMVGVRRPLRIEFYIGADLVVETTMRPWIGTAAARCDRVIERRP